MKASRSIIWTLAQPQVPALPVEVRERLARQVRSRVAERPDPLLRRAAAALDADSFFARDAVRDHVLGADGTDSGDPFLAALGQVDPDGPIGREFIVAALAEWLANGDGRAEALRDSGLPTQLGIPIPDSATRVVVPRDFCDDSETGEDVGLPGRSGGARKVCYGIFRSDFPPSAVEATDPANWHRRLPGFWLLSQVRAAASHSDGRYRYDAGLLVEEVDLPNVLGAFGPVVLIVERTTALDGSWSFLAYRLADLDAVEVDQGWYFVHRRAGGPDSAIMVKLIEFYGRNDWLDSVCENGLLEGGRRLLGVAQGAGARRPGPAGGPLTGVMSGYLDQMADHFTVMAEQNVEEIRTGLAGFESKPLRFSWVDNVFGVVANSTDFLSRSATSWANVVQQDLPDALDRADVADPESRTTPAHIVGAGWKTVLGLYKAGNDLSRAALQMLGPGEGRDDGPGGPRRR